MPLESGPDWRATGAHSPSTMARVATQAGPSRSQIRKAARTLRKWWTDESAAVAAVASGDVPSGHLDRPPRRGV